MGMSIGVEQPTGSRLPLHCGIMERNLLITLSLLIAVSSASLLGEDKCSQGPAYWCTSVKEAAECGSVDYCINNDWKNYKVQNTDVSDLPCKVCMDVVKDLRDFVGDPKLEAEVQKVWQQGCDLLPAPFKAECEEIGTKYIPETIQIIKSELDPEAVCHAIGLCNSIRNQPHVSDQPCEFCKNTIKDLKQAVKQPDFEEKVKEIWHEICLSVHEPMKEKCEEIGGYIPKIIQILKSDMSPEIICHMIGLCKSDETPELNLQTFITNMENVRKLGSVECAGCKMIISYLEHFLRESTTIEEVKEVLEDACELLPVSTKLKAECKYGVDSFAGVIIKIVTTTPPETICSVLRLCSSEVTAELNTFDISNFLTPIMASDDIECKVCMKVIEEVKNRISSTSRKVTEEDLKQICYELPSSKMAPACLKHVEIYSEKIIKNFNNMNTKQVCKLLRLC